MNDLPSICPAHPDAEIRHEYLLERCVWNGEPRGLGIEKDHHYYCSVCGLEVCSPNEFIKRMEQKQKELEDEKCQ